ncbi:MAG: hypothetical protein QOI04_1995 [Verrucomicrobiota bacterium]|jgi:sporulation protein YlmC with PRC-barrel domain
MKKSILLGATFAFLGLAVAPTFAQTQSTTSTTTTGYIESSKIIGTTVKSAQGEEIGTIKDVVLDRNTGCLAYTVLSTGGTTSRLTGSAKTVAVPWTVYSASSDPRVMTVRVEKEKIYNAPVFEYSRVQEYSSSGWINNVNSYYGVSAGVSTGVGVNYQSNTNVGGTATTNTSASQTTATTAASPSVSASPMATATPAVSASPSASVSPAASASASSSASTSTTASPSESASPKESTAKDTGKAGHRKPVSPQHHGEEMMGTKEKSAEKSSTDTTGEAATSSGSSKKSSTSASESESPSKKSTHHRAGQSTSPGAESSATPKSSDEPQQ